MTSFEGGVSAFEVGLGLVGAEQLGGGHRFVVGDERERPVGGGVGGDPGGVGGERQREVAAVDPPVWLIAVEAACSIATRWRSWLRGEATVAANSPNAAVARSMRSARAVASGARLVDERTHTMR